MKCCQGHSRGENVNDVQISICNLLSPQLVETSNDPGVVCVFFDQLFPIETEIAADLDCSIAGLSRKFGAFGDKLLIDTVLASL